MIGALFLLATALGLLALVSLGDAGDRWMVLAVVVSLALTPLLESWQYDNIRVGVAVVEIGFFGVLWLFAERTNRAWATAAAGFQLVSVLSFVPAAVGAESFVWSGVALRYGAWGLITLTFFGGGLECWAERRLRREANDDQDFRTDDQTLARSFRK